MKLPQKTSFGSETCEIGSKVAIWIGFPPEDSPLFYRASIDKHKCDRHKDEFGQKRKDMNSERQIETDRSI